MSARKERLPGPCRQVRSITLKNGGIFMVEIFGNYAAMCRADRRLIENILDAMEDRAAVIRGEERAAAQRVTEALRVPRAG